MDEAVGAALKALENAECAKLFQGREGTPDPAAFLEALQSGQSSYGYIVVDAETSRPGSKTNAVTRATFGYAVGPNGQLVNTGVNGAVVTINSDQSTPFNSKYSTVDRAVTVLHELGYVYELLFGGGAGQVQNDQDDTKKSMDNTALVKETCFK